MLDGGEGCKKTIAKHTNLHNAIQSLDCVISKLCNLRTRITGDDESEGKGDKIESDPNLSMVLSLGAEEIEKFKKKMYDLIENIESNLF